MERSYVYRVAVLCPVGPALAQEEANDRRGSGSKLEQSAPRGDTDAVARQSATASKQQVDVFHKWSRLQLLVGTVE